MRGVSDGRTEQAAGLAPGEEAVNPGDQDVLDDVAAGEFAAVARRWIGPFRDSFPDFTMETADLVADTEKAKRELGSTPAYPSWRDGSRPGPRHSSPGRPLDAGA